MNNNIIFIGRSGSEEIKEPPDNLFGTCLTFYGSSNQISSDRAKVLFLCIDIIALATNKRHN